MLYLCCNSALTSKAYTMYSGLAIRFARPIDIGICLWPALIKNEQRHVFLLQAGWMNLHESYSENPITQRKDEKFII